jgi:hypothetical protein
VSYFIAIVKDELLNNYSEFLNRDNDLSLKLIFAILPKNVGSYLLLMRSALSSFLLLRSNIGAFIYSHESRFFLAGLRVKKLPDWTARQQAYLAAVKEFLTKLKPEFASLPILYVKAIRHEPKLLLSVECSKAKQ